MSPTKTVYMLRNLQDRSDVSLDGYEFLDETHARQWLGQAFVTDQDYRLVIQEVRPPKRCCPQCGYRGKGIVLKSRVFKPSVFLAMQEVSA